MMPTPVIDGIVRFLSEKSLKAYEIHFVRPSALSCFLTPVMNKTGSGARVGENRKKGRVEGHECPASTNPSLSLLLFARLNGPNNLNPPQKWAPFYIACNGDVAPTMPVPVPLRLQVSFIFKV